MTGPGEKARAVRVLVADYSALFRSGMRRVIEAEPDLEVVGEAGGVDEIAAMAARENPDVIVVGSVGGRWAGVVGSSAGSCDVGPEKACPGRSCVLIAVVDLAGGGRHTLDAVFDAFGAGVLGCVDRSISGEDLVHAIRAVSSRRYFASSQVVRVLVNELARLREVASGFEEAVAHAVTAPAAPVSSAAGTSLHLLTPRESEVLSLVAFGKSNREIACALSISEKTVKNHVSSVLRKLGAGRRTQAAVWAISQGLSGVLGQKSHNQSPAEK